MKLLTLSSCVILLAAVEAGAANLKVPSHYPSIQDAVNAAAPGDTVKVSSGTYYENVDVNGKTGITIKGTGSDGVVIDAGGSGTPLTVQGSQEITVQDLTLKNSADSYGIAVVFSEDVVVDGCTVKDVSLAGIFVLFCVDARIEDSKVKNTDDDGIVLITAACTVTGSTVKNVGGHGILVIGELNTIASNTVKSAAYSGIRLGEDPATCDNALVIGNEIEGGADGIYLDITAMNCSILENSIEETSSEGIEIEVGADGHLLDGNSIKSCGDDGMELNGSNLIISRNTVKKSVDDGIWLQSSATGCLLYQNKSKKSGDNGFDVDGTGNSLVENTGKKSDNYDLKDDNAPGANAYTANTFSTVSP